jgi:hypothetical protein
MKLLYLKYWHSDYKILPPFLFTCRRLVHFWTSRWQIKSNGGTTRCKFWTSDIKFWQKKRNIQSSFSSARNDGNFSRNFSTESTLHIVKILIKNTNNSYILQENHVQLCTKNSGCKRHSPNWLQSSNKFLVSKFTHGGSFHVPWYDKLLTAHCITTTRNNNDLMAV